MARPENSARKPAGLTRTQRLTKRAEFESILQHPDIRLTRFPVRLVAKANSFGFARLGMTVSKRNIRSAVHRNRVKRLLREWFRLHAGRFCPYDIVLSVREYSPSEERLKAALLEVLDVWDRRTSTTES